MARYELLQGTHAEGNAVYKAPLRTPEGELLGERTFVESDKDLEKIYGSARFKKVEDLRVEGGPKFQAAPKREAPKDAPEDAQAAPGVEETSPDTTSGLGDDVSDQFPEAAKGDLLVFKKGSFYSVADADKPDVALNQYEITNKAQVEEFIRSFLES